MLHTQLIIGKQIVLSNLNDVSVCPNGADILWSSAPLELENKIVQKKIREAFLNCVYPGFLTHSFESLKEADIRQGPDEFNFI